MTTIKFRRGTESQWAAVNPVLAYGEPGWARDTEVLKIGDGVSAWNDLDPFAGSGGGGGTPPDEDTSTKLSSYTMRSAATKTAPSIWRTDLNDALEIDYSNIAEHKVGGKVRSWLNEWGALRGRNPYSTWGDALVRGIIMAGDYVENGNFSELLDRRREPEDPRYTIYGRRWADGRLVRNSIPMVDIYYHEGDPTTVPWEDLPTPCVIIAQVDLMNELSPE